MRGRGKKMGGKRAIYNEETEKVTARRRRRERMTLKTKRIGRVKEGFFWQLVGTENEVQRNC